MPVLRLFADIHTSRRTVLTTEGICFLAELVRGERGDEELPGLVMNVVRRAAIEYVDDYLISGTDWEFRQAALWLGLAGAIREEGGELEDGPRCMISYLLL